MARAILSESVGEKPALSLIRFSKADIYGDRSAEPSYFKRAIVYHSAGLVPAEEASISGMSEIPLAPMRSHCHSSAPFAASL